MEIISEEISAINASVSIEYPKVSCLFPVSAVLRLANIQYNGNTVLIILSNWPLIGRGWIGTNVSVGILGVLRWLKIWYGIQNFRQRWMLILIDPKFPFLYLKIFSLQINLLSDYLILLSCWRLWFWSRLILHLMLSSRSFRKLQPLVWIIKPSLLGVGILRVEILSVFCGKFGGGRF